MASTLIRSNGITIGRMPINPTPTIWLVCHGDSITREPTSVNTYPILLGGLVRNAHPTEVVADICIGHPGDSWNYDWPGSPDVGTLISLAPTEVDPFLAKTGTKWLIAFAGTNSWNNQGLTGAQAYADFQTYISARIATGWPPSQIIIPTMLPKDAPAETFRTDYNSRLVSGASTYGYKLARFDLDPTMGQAGQSSNLTYYRDGLHPTETGGHPILAQILYSVIYP